MKGDTDLQTLKVEKTLPRKVVEGERCSSRSFQNIESKKWGGSEEKSKEPHSEDECGRCYTSKV